MKDYYEILEVSTNASQEVIEKAYKALAKKYHPDVQEPNKVKWAEEKFKEISEAYETLSNEEKKSQYDSNFNNYKKNTIESTFENPTKNANINTNYSDLLLHTEELKKELDALKNQKNSENFILKAKKDKAFNDAISKAYNDAYIKRLKDYGYKIRYKKSLKTRFKNFISLIITLIIILIILYILWHIPVVKSYCIDLYNNNEILKLFKNLFFE